MSARESSTSTTWWGEQALSTGEAAFWRIGPFGLTVLRGQREWQIAYEWDPELEESQEWELRTGAAWPEGTGKQERHVVGETGERLSLSPALADRPIVSSPRVPFYLLPERETTLYVGSPVWVRIAVGEPAVQLRELPTRRPSDTWFGESTREGELCYATKTRALLNLDNLPPLGRSAVTPVVIRNQAPDPLWLEKLKLPVPLLSLFAAADGRLWTESVLLTRTEESGMASLDVNEGPPDEADGARELTQARRTPEPSAWIRAFSSLFG